MFTGKKDISVSEVSHGEPAKVCLQTGEEIAQIKSKRLDRRSRRNILFRIVGNNLHGWSESAEFWGGTVEVITHRV